MKTTTFMRDVSQIQMKKSEIVPINYDKICETCSKDERSELFSAMSK